MRNVRLLLLIVPGLRGCPGGDMKACVEVCLERPKLYSVCAEACEEQCDDSGSRRRLQNEDQTTAAQSQCLHTTVNELGDLATNAANAVTIMRQELTQLQNQVDNFSVGYLMDRPGDVPDQRPIWAQLGANNFNLLSPNTNPSYSDGVDAHGGSCWPQDFEDTTENGAQTVYIFFLKDEQGLNDVPNTPFEMMNGYYNANSFYIGNEAFEYLDFEELEVCVGSSEDCGVRSCFTLTPQTVGSASCGEQSGLAGLSDAWKQQVGIGIGLCPAGQQGGQMLANRATINAARFPGNIKWMCSGDGQNSPNGNQYMHVSGCGITYMPDNNTNEMGWYRNPGHVNKEDATSPEPYQSSASGDQYSRAGYHCCNLGAHATTHADLFFIRGRTWSGEGASDFLRVGAAEPCGCYL